LAQCIGYFLRVCPGLNKTTIGELLGEPDRFYLKVGLCLQSYVGWSVHVHACVGLNESDYRGAAGTPRQVSRQDVCRCSCDVCMTVLCACVCALG
jgi:hypothetical protein